MAVNVNKGPAAQDFKIEIIVISASMHKVFKEFYLTKGLFCKSKLLQRRTGIAERGVRHWGEEGGVGGGVHQGQGEVGGE